MVEKDDGIQVVTLREWRALAASAPLPARVPLKAVGEALGSAHPTAISLLLSCHWDLGLELGRGLLFLDKVDPFSKPRG